MVSKNNHCFSFYYAELSSCKFPSCVITDSTLVHRLANIMRYQMGDVCMLFDKVHHVYAQIVWISKKEIHISCGTKELNAKIEPELVLFLPLLKKDALEQAVYNSVVAGVSAIQLIVTEKCHRKHITTSERERLQKIIIAACEQSKYYMVPPLYETKTLHDACSTYKNYKKYYTDFDGESLTRLTEKSVIMVGPEGDLTVEEKKYMQDQGAYFFVLTPTVLRSQEAVLVAVAHARMI